MKARVSVYMGIGKYNRNTIYANNYELDGKYPTGHIEGSEGFEKIKLCESELEVGELPDIDSLHEERKAVLLREEQERHAKRMAELTRNAA